MTGTRTVYITLEQEEIKAHIRGILVTVPPDITDDEIESCDPSIFNNIRQPIRWESCGTVGYRCPTIVEIVAADYETESDGTVKRTERGLAVEPQISA